MYSCCWSRRDWSKSGPMPSWTIWEFVKISKKIVEKIDRSETKRKNLESRSSLLFRISKKRSTTNWNSKRIWEFYWISHGTTFFSRFDKKFYSRSTKTSRFSDSQFSDSHTFRFSTFQISCFQTFKYSDCQIVWIPKYN